MSKQNIIIPPLDKDLRQKQLEGWEDYYNARAKEVRGKNRVNGLIIRAAVAGGWFVDINFTEEDVDNLTGKQSIALAQQISDLYDEVMGIDEKKS